VAVEATNAASVAERQLKRIGEMLEISSAMRANAEVVKQLRVYVRMLTICPSSVHLLEPFRDRINESNRSIENARRTKQEAEKKKQQNQTSRVRFFFSFYSNLMLIYLLHVRTDSP
jgi:hypothetical protein